MSAVAIIHALALPEGARVDQRVPKKLLVENGAPTAADKRRSTTASKNYSGSRPSSRPTLAFPNTR